MHIENEKDRLHWLLAVSPYPVEQTLTRYNQLRTMVAHEEGMDRAMNEVLERKRARQN